MSKVQKSVCLLFQTSLSLYLTAQTSGAVAYNCHLVLVCSHSRVMCFVRFKKKTYLGTDFAKLK